MSFKNAMRSIIPKAPPDYQTRKEYLEQLNKWMNEARLWHGICSGMPHSLSDANVQNSDIINNRGFQIYLGNNGNIRNRIHLQVNRYYEYKIPPIWKRVAAETLDFCLLLVTKVFMSYAVLQFFEMEVEDYAINYYKKLQDPKNAFRISVEILVLEIVYRLFVCFYEAYWTCTYPCATPGKRYMGLKVVYVENIISMPGREDETVRAHPCAPLGFFRALTRAVLKNIFVGLILPICFIVLFFKHNRTGYDVVCNTLVVETDEEIQRPNN